ncbi:hypothetical protein [Luteimonas sp. TWI1416]|uniref:hypothetical protein n=1 Tax=unclassified Luteimonas TaxID=2629088 RepID=UPI003209CD13
MSEGEPILYSTEDGAATIGLRAIDGIVWLIQLEMAELFETSKQNTSLHINNLLPEGVLAAESVVKESLTTAADGKASSDVATSDSRLRMDVAQKLAVERFDVVATNCRAADALSVDEADIAQLVELEEIAKSGRKKGSDDA